MSLKKNYTPPVDYERFRIAVEELRWQCDPALFEFVSTEELEPLREFIGQNRAIRSIEFGLAIEHPGYNIFATA